MRKIIATFVTFAVFAVTFVFPAGAAAAIQGVPVLQAAGFSKGHIRLSWTPVAGAEKYMMYQAKAGDAQFAVVGATDATSYTLPGFADGAEYHFAVQPIDDLGGGNYAYGGFSNQATAVSGATAPQVTAVTASKSVISLSWDPVNGADSYNVFGQQAQGWVKLVTTADLTYNSAGLAANTSYHFFVNANILGAAGDSSPAVTAKTFANVKYRGLPGEWAANNFSLGGATALTLRTDNTYSVNGKSAGRYSAFLLDNSNREVYLTVSGKEYVLIYNSYYDRLYYGNNYFYKV